MGNVRHHLNPPLSGFVVLLGPDGSGKSSVADGVADRLYKQPFKVCTRFEYQFRILPELKRLKHVGARLIGRPPKAIVAVEPGTLRSGMNHDHGPIKGIGYVTYYTIDFMLGRLAVRKLRAQGGLILFARYFYDYYYQLGYGRVPRWYLRVIERLVPKPDLVIYLHREASAIYKDKPELDVEEIERQQNVLRTLIAGRPDAVVVDASSGLDATVDEVCRLVRERCLGL